MTADWAGLEGQVVGGVFPLLQLLGSSERSAVFLSRRVTDSSPNVALKLVPAAPGRAELFLPRWRAAAALDHPHLLRLFDVGECEVGEQRYLYFVMEHAEQNLAQLLEHRALEPNEVRDMLGPTLNALEFLHGAKCVHGGLKPSNVLVVGEHVKLASDAIGLASPIVNNGGAGVAALSPYQPPEAHGSGRTTAGDIWALGVMTCEALSRRRPAGLHAMGGSIALPADIPPTFAEMISNCLSRKPQGRPDVAKLQAWLKGGQLEPMPAAKQEAAVGQASVGPASVAEAGVADDVQAATSATSTRLVIRAKLVPQGEVAESVEPKAQWRPMPLIIAATVLLASAVAVIYFVVSRETPPEVNSPATVAHVAAEAPQPEAPTLPPAPPPQAPVVEAPSPVAARAAAGNSPSSINEVMPVVPRSASDTIRGTIRVAVRVTVDEDGKVVAATSEVPGPSRYFERLSLQAAKKWKFAPVETGGQRSMLVKFNYTRSGTTAKADAPATPR